MFWYQINPDYFKQIVEKKNLFKTLPQDSFYSTVLKSLDYLKALKVDGIWLMPIYIRGEKNKKGTGSPYAVKEYYPDPRFGSEEELKELIKAAHVQKLKIITEYVPNHLAPDASFITENPDVVYADANGVPLYDQNWSDTVKLVHKNPKVWKFTQDNMVRILKTYNFDGFRLDMAHGPFYDIDNKPFMGDFDPLFWQHVLDHEYFKTNEVILLAEVYDDRNHDMSGYADHLRLMKNNMTVYDKKTHDLFAHKLKDFEFHDPFQELFNRELEFQNEAINFLKNKNYTDTPFLRIPTNHDDNPGVKNFGGVHEYVIGFLGLTLITGSSVIYAGDEFGLSVQPSRTGENKISDDGTPIESTEIQFVNDTDQEYINTNIKKIIELKNLDQFSNGNILIARVLDRENCIQKNMFCFARFNLEDKAFYLVCINTSKSEEKQWGKITEFYPTLDNKFEEYQFNSILKKVLKIRSKAQYKVKNVYIHKSYGHRDFNEELWVGLDPLEVQILELSI